tara:strand:+ start:2148 stop:2468 length:321 start_codon:yes stop_codon:yes gene_type:complete
MFNHRHENNQRHWGAVMPDQDEILKTRVLGIVDELADFKERLTDKEESNRLQAAWLERQVCLTEELLKYLDFVDDHVGHHTFSQDELKTVETLEKLAFILVQRHRA